MVVSPVTQPNFGPVFWAWRSLGFLASSAAATALLVLVAH
jgi:hypothetical protein